MCCCTNTLTMGSSAKQGFGVWPHCCCSCHMHTNETNGHLVVVVVIV